MRRPTSVFSAGPDAYLANGEALIARKRELCEVAGLALLTSAKPAAEPDASLRSGELQARQLYSDSLQALRTADLVIANLTPWRGPGCEAATAFLAGFASALGKPVFAYLNVDDEDQAEYLGRVATLVGAEPDVHGVWRDPDGAEVEDLELPESLMLWSEARRFYVIVTPEPLDDATGFEMCLAALADYVE